MSKEMTPNNGRAIDINSPTAKSIIEGVVPKAIRTWTIFKNTNNTLEGIEAMTFAMWQVALDEIEKESDDIVFMSDTTVNLIRSNIKRLQAENERLKKRQITKNGFICDCEQNVKYRQTLEEIQNFLDVPEFYIYDKEVIHNRIENKINEALK